MKKSACSTDTVRSDLMRRVRQKGTVAEGRVAQILSGFGLRYRRNVRSLPGSPDFANKSRKWAMFVNGCFWHHHSGCPRATVPKRNRTFWTEKFRANKSRDADKTDRLRRQGFRVMTVWECELEGKSLRKRMAKFAGSIK
jgi:DNA mismatch endonuclease, patch repair protein